MVKKIKNTMFSAIIFSLLFQIGCSSNQDRKKYSQIKTTILNELVIRCPSLLNRDFIIYYFDPKCGLCFAQASELEKNFINNKEIKTVFIVNSEIKDEVEFNIERFGLQSCVLVDTDIFSENEFILNNKVKVYKNGKTIAYVEKK